ncbi:MAG TPA: cytochrome c oxidase subunit 3 [Acidimicrobiales bacterium]|jgi:heme/copper-type cytochrome/quinol oxidase subunit 3|nr:cytochrome c oxidase subunit 3 [Acidimicrobiales bacterium]
MTLVIHDDSIGLPPAAPPARPRVLLIGTGFALAGIAMAFAGLIGLYIGRRAEVIEANQSWLPQGVTIDLTPGNVALVGLLISSVVMQWAVYSIANDDRPRAYLALGLTVLLGAAYINGMAFNYTQIGITVHEPVGLLIFTITGMHLAMAGAGMLFVGLMTFRALGGQYSGRDREGIVAAAMYWHVTVLIFVVIWFTIFVTK